jgi:cytosine/adenosine deaminase-related metal-dependent hydrolase
MDANVGDFPAGDVLIENGRIAAVGRSIVADDADVIDAAGHIVMPGLVDSHRHTWQSCVRHRCGDMDSPGYFEEMLFRRGPRYRPEDVYIATLLGAVSALDSGTTTMLDWAHIVNTPDHSDAAITALADSGVRAIFGHGWPLIDPASWMVDSVRGHPEDIRRLRTQFFVGRRPPDAGDGRTRPRDDDPEVWRSDLRLARSSRSAPRSHGRGWTWTAISRDRADEPGGCIGR